MQAVVPAAAAWQLVQAVRSSLVVPLQASPGPLFQGLLMQAECLLIAAQAPPSSWRHLFSYLLLYALPIDSHASAFVFPPGTAKFMEAMKEKHDANLIGQVGAAALCSSSCLHPCQNLLLTPT